MVSDRPSALRGLLAAASLLGLGIGAAPVSAQGSAKPGPSIYTCKDAQGRKLTSDRPIAECSDREQQQLNGDGSVRRVLPPELTPQARAERDARQRQQEQAQAAQADAVRRDRNLLTRYPNEAAHARARQSALETVRQASKAGEQRLATLATERRKLDDEAEFYKGRALPAALKQQLDANDAAVEAQRQAARAQATEWARLNTMYDSELGHLRRLWAGAAPGSLPRAAAPAASAEAGLQVLPAADAGSGGKGTAIKR